MVAMPLARGFLSLGGRLERLALAAGARLAKAASAMADHPITGPVVPGPAAVVQLALLTLILVVVYVALG